MADPRPLRVVEYPGTPGDWGVAVVSRAPSGRRIYEVLWRDGHSDEYHPATGRLSRTHDGKRPVTITHRKPALRRAMEWCLAAIAADPPICGCCRPLPEHVHA